MPKFTPEDRKAIDEYAATRLAQGDKPRDIAKDLADHWRKLNEAATTDAEPREPNKAPAGMPESAVTGSGGPRMDVTLSMLGGPNDADAVFAARSHGIDVGDMSIAQITSMRANGMSFAEIARMNQNRAAGDQGDRSYYNHVRWDAGSGHMHRE